MSTHNNIESGTILGTVSGTVLTVAVNVGSSDILKTVILASLGAVVSFSVSLLLKWLVKRFK
jgi:mannitol-specific phosphotransferase system IIBC component